jgi:hypothetical protein
MTALAIKASRRAVARRLGRSSTGESAGVSGLHVIAARCDMTLHYGQGPAAARRAAGVRGSGRLRRQPAFGPRTRNFRPWAASLTPCGHENVCKANSDLDGRTAGGDPRSHAGKAEKPGTETLNNGDPGRDPGNAGHEVALAGHLFDRATACAAAAPVRAVACLLTPGQRGCGTVPARPVQAGTAVQPVTGPGRRTGRREFQCSQCCQCDSPCYLCS